MDILEIAQEAYDNQQAELEEMRREAQEQREREGRKRLWNLRYRRRYI